MSFEKNRPYEAIPDNTEVRAYGLDWTITGRDHKGRYTLQYEHWVIYAVDQIQVRRKEN